MEEIKKLNQIRKASQLILNLLSLSDDKEDIINIVAMYIALYSNGVSIPLEELIDRIATEARSCFQYNEKVKRNIGL